MTKKTAIQVLKIAVSLGLYFYIFWKVVDIGHLWEELKGAKLTYFIAAVVVYYVAQAVSAYRWYLMLKPLEIKTRYPKLLSYYFLGMFFNFLMPTAIGGDVFRVYYLNKETRRLSASTASVFIDRDIGMAGLVLVAAMVATYAGTAIAGVPLAPIFWLVMAGFMLANLALFYRPTYNILHRLLKLFKMKKADERVEHLFSSFNAFRGQWGLLLTALLLSIAVQVGCAFVSLLTADAIGLTTRNGWIDYLIFIPTIGLITMVPVSVNGMGWREFAYIVFFQSVGATEPQAAALAFMWLGVTVLTSLPGGIIYALRGGKASTDLPREDDLIESNSADYAKISEFSTAPAGEEPVRTI
jgi:uncharacterized protein (TIRG00374 family)